MNRLRRYVAQRRQRVPRTRGDEPEYLELAEQMEESSPHTRG